MKAMDILAGDHRQRFFGFRSFSLDVYYIDSSPREPRFVLVPLRFASEAWPRAGLGEPRSASNANKPASSWPRKQGRKKCSKHGCDLGTSTVSVLFHCICLTVVSLSFHPHIFTRPAYRCDRCALVLVMPARPRSAISGILAGGIPGFCIATFLLGTCRSIR